MLRAIALSAFLGLIFHGTAWAQSAQPRDCNREVLAAMAAARQAGLNPRAATDALKRECLASEDRRIMDRARARLASAAPAIQPSAPRHFLPCVEYGRFAAGYAHERNRGVPLRQQLAGLPRGADHDRVIVATAETMLRDIYAHPQITPGEAFAMGRDACGWPGRSPPAAVR